jgi:hypothetical protein
MGLSLESAFSLVKDSSFNFRKSWFECFLEKALNNQNENLANAHVHDLYRSDFLGHVSLRGLIQNPKYSAPLFP